MDVLDIAIVVLGGWFALIVIEAIGSRTIPSWIEARKNV